MQASWGAENGAPGPLRGGKLFGEKGTWKVSMECSVPDVFTYADKEVRGGDDPDVKFRTKQYVQKGPVQALSTKKPAEMDICANGMAHVIRTSPARTNTRWQTMIMASSGRLLGVMSRQGSCRW